MTAFTKLPAQINLPQVEESILALWERLQAFPESDRRRQAENAPEFVFYDGPPFATGTPHYGHLLAGTIKDIVPRFWTMRGYHVERRFGWDCHGLPIEALAQKELNLHGAAAIRQAGVGRFNEQCRSMVQTYVNEWRRTVTRMGRWVDFDRDYKTMDRDFMESVWWVFKRLWNKQRIYRSYRIMPFSPKLSTPLSKFEVKDDNYKVVQDPAVTVKFRVRKDVFLIAKNNLERLTEAERINPGTQQNNVHYIDRTLTPSRALLETFAPSDEPLRVVIKAIEEGRAFVLAWTTTPWTLPANLALCVGPQIDYVWLERTEDIAGTEEKRVYVVARERIQAVFPIADSYRELVSMRGEKLDGLYYESLFDYSFLQERQEWDRHTNIILSDNEKKGKGRGFTVVVDPFVTTTDGTGVVHIAPAYGEDDYRVARANHIVLHDSVRKNDMIGEGAYNHEWPSNLIDPLDDECKFTAQIPEYAGQFCKDADKAIIKRLKDEGKLFAQATISHPYPFCDRTDAPLIYRAIDAWYVKVEDLRDKLVANNATIHWVPEAVGSNRFGNWLKNANDWNISRNRFWGSCIPVWINVADANDTICIGSVTELEQLSGQRVSDLHKHILDDVVIVRDGKIYKRTPEVLDCWFESGSMPYASVHWMGGSDGIQPPPVFPAQFIAEGLDQTRGWFYTLLVLSTSLFDQPAFRNVVVNGLVLAEDGQKMSKSKKNYPDPHVVLDAYGADALRAYLINSPVVRAEPLKFSEAGLKEIVRTVVLPYWNAASFFTTYATVDGWDAHSPRLPVAQRHEIDRWLLSVMQSLIRDVNAEMEAYRLYNVVPRLLSFIDDLTNWYIRRSRPRFWKNRDASDQSAAYATLYEALTTFATVLAPFMPFLTEELYQRLVVAVDPTATKSVHWCDYPQADASLIDAGLEQRMAVVRQVVGLGLKLRNQEKLKVRQPLATLTVISRDPAVRAAVAASAALIGDELNLQSVLVDANEAAVCAVSVKPNFAALRARAGAKLKDIGTTLASWGHGEVAVLESGQSVTVAGIEFTAADVLLTRLPLAGASSAIKLISDGSVTLAVDTALTPALISEGLAREAISLLQQARKDAGLEVSDRITVTWATTSAELNAALVTHAATIGEEILAVNFVQKSAIGTEGTTSLECSGHPLTITLALTATKA